MKVLRVYHAGRDSTHLARDEALAAIGATITLLVPSQWPGDGPEPIRGSDDVEIVELPVRRAGDVNRHVYRDAVAVRALLDRVRPDVVDLHEEPFSAVTHQMLGLLPPQLPVVGYAAQNIDKRFPPPFARWEAQALRRFGGLYPCSRQAASVLRGKGFTGPIAVLPLGVATARFAIGGQQLGDGPLMLGIVGRLVPEKGVLDAVKVLAELIGRGLAARLVIVGDGPQREAAERLASELGVRAHVEVRGWLDADELAQVYRGLHVLLVPSTATDTWAEQFGRVVVEAQACGAVAVGYASGALPELIDDPARLVAPTDVAALADAVTSLVADPHEWAQTRIACSAKVLDWAGVAQAQYELYRTVLAADAAKYPAGRHAAVAEFGPPARIGAIARPFALPLLRRDTVATRTLAGVLDRVSGNG